MAHQASATGGAASSTSALRARGDRPTENQFAFAQRKLEENYSKVYRALVKWQTVFDVGQEVLVWKRPVLAAVLYLAVHALFLYVSSALCFYLCVDYKYIYISPYTLSSCIIHSLSFSPPLFFHVAVSLLIMTVS